MIIKERQVIFNRLILVISLVFIFSCENRKEQKAVTLVSEKNSVLAEVLKSDLELKPNIGLVFYKNESFTGISYQNYSNGNKAEEIFYVEGVKHGSYKKWYPDGILSFQSNYSKGLQNGTTTSWWKDGKMRSIANHSDGVVHGIQKQWYQEGELFKEINIVDGKEEGLQRSWRRNGKLYNNYEAKNGRIFGLKRANLCYELEDEIVQTKK